MAKKLFIMIAEEIITQDRRLNELRRKARDSGITEDEHQELFMLASRANEQVYSRAKRSEVIDCSIRNVNVLYCE